MLLPKTTLSVVNVACSKQCCPLDDLTDVCIIRYGIYKHLCWVVRTTPVASRTIGKIVVLSFVIAHCYYHYYSHYHHIHHDHYDYHHFITFFFFVITPHYGVSCPRAKVKHYKRIKRSVPSVSSSKSVL